MPHRGWGYKVDLLLLPVLPTSPGAEHLAAPSAQEFWSAAYFLSPTLHLPNDFVSSAIPYPDPQLVPDHPLFLKAFFEVIETLCVL